MNKVLILLVIALIGTVAILSHSLKREKAETERLTGNQSSLMNDVTYYRAKDSLSAASVERLQLTNDEFGKYCSDLERTVKDLDIKVKRLQSVSSTGTETDYDVDIPIRDSVNVRDSTIILKCLELHTSYLDISGCIEEDRFKGNILSRDTLDQIVHRVPKQFWFIKWGCKAIRQEIICRNPNSRIVYSQYIELKK